MHSYSLFVTKHIDRTWVLPLWNGLDFLNFVVYITRAMISRTFTPLADIK